MDNYHQTVVIDWQLARKLAGGEELAKNLMQMLIKQLPSYRYELRVAYQNHSYEKFYQTVHKIYGATSYCGTPQLNEIAKQLEQTIRHLRLEDLEHDYAALQQAIDQLEEAYQHDYPTWH